jgi:hypothetical protein
MPNLGLRRGGANTSLVGEKLVRRQDREDRGNDERPAATTQTARATFGQSRPRLHERRSIQPSIATAPEAKSIG